MTTSKTTRLDSAHRRQERATFRNSAINAIRKHYADTEFNVVVEQNDNEGFMVIVEKAGEEFVIFNSQNLDYADRFAIGIPQNGGRIHIPV